MSASSILSAETSGLHKVIRGSGMGLNFSLELADAAYANRVDKCLMQAGVHRRFGVKKWWRFKDDVLIVVKPICRQELLHLIQNRADPDFVVVEDHCSSVSVDFLSVRVEVNRSGRESTGPVLRPPAVPLSVSSAHPASVHCRWPTGFARSLMLLCSSDCRKNNTYEEFYSRFERAHDLPARLRLLQRPAETIRDRREEISSRPEELWLVLPFHLGGAKVPLLQVSESSAARLRLDMHGLTPGLSPSDQTCRRLECLGSLPLRG